MFTSTKKVAASTSSKQLQRKLRISIFSKRRPANKRVAFFFPRKKHFTAKNVFNIVLYEPEIPHNTGAAGRLALATGSKLHLIKPLGFSLDDKYVRRTGLDYWQDVDVSVWENFEEFLESVKNPTRMFFLSTKGTKTHWETSFQKGDYLIFGPESRGLPDNIRDRFYSQLCKIPMEAESTRSLNLATAIAIVLYEGYRQVKSV